MLIKNSFRLLKRLAPFRRIDKNFLLTRSEHFCMAPWTSLQIRPDGSVYNCCLSQEDGLLGNAKTSSLTELWNSKKMREIRSQMLGNERVPACTYCYQLEKNTDGSFRKKFNSDFASHFDHLVPSTGLTGKVKKLNLAYWDFRLSNFCNLKCRSCGHASSSSWYEDTLKLNGQPSAPKPIDRVIDYRPAIIDELLKQLPFVEEIYFAGGEPLMMEEHYQIMQALIDAKRTDVRIWYNTNFSTLKWKNVDVTELWNQFPSVKVQASLDGSYKRGEYLRKGLKWNRVIENRKRLQEKCPHVRFQISATTSCYNVWHLPDFFEEWLQLGFVKEDDFTFNPLYGPEYMSVHVLPRKFREEVVDKYRACSQRLVSSARVRNRFHNLEEWLLEKEDLGQSEVFQEMTQRLDAIRNEKFKDVFPEIGFMMDKYK